MSLLDTAHEIWATAQLLPGEGIVDGVGRVESLLSQCRKEARKEALLEGAVLADAWGEARNPDNGGHALRNYANELRRMAESTMEGEK